LRAEAHPLPNRILMRPIVFGEFLIHDDDELVVGVVVLIEKASANQPNADGFEVIADDLRRCSGGLVGIARIDIAFGDKCPVEVAACGGEGVGQAHGLNARLLPELPEQLVIEVVDLCLRRVLRPRQCIDGGSDVVGTESEIDGTHLAETAQEKAGSGEQDKRNGDFHDNERGAQACMAAA
jgi:hypothetical protein